MGGGGGYLQVQILCFKLLQRGLTLSVGVDAEFVRSAWKGG